MTRIHRALLLALAVSSIHLLGAAQPVRPDECMKTCDAQDASPPATLPAGVTASLTGFIDGTAMPTCSTCTRCKVSIQVSSSQPAGTNNCITYLDFSQPGSWSQPLSFYSRSGGLRQNCQTGANPEWDMSSYFVFSVQDCGSQPGSGQQILMRLSCPCDPEPPE